MATPVQAQRTVVLATLAAGAVIVGAELRTGTDKTTALKAGGSVFAAALLLSVAADEWPEVALAFGWLILATALLTDGPRLFGKVFAAGKPATPQAHD